MYLFFNIYYYDSIILGDGGMDDMDMDRYMKDISDNQLDLIGKYI